MKVVAEISVGELIDKLTILELKLRHILEPAKRANILRERAKLSAIVKSEIAPAPGLAALASELGSVNAKLWDVEDALRLREREGRFDAEFIALARSVYVANDRRARLKQEINQLTHSEIVEEKSYAAY